MTFKTLLKYKQREMQYMILHFLCYVHLSQSKDVRKKEKSNTNRLYQ